jgi:spermidine/putrescine-binding protein
MNRTRLGILVVPILLLALAAALAPSPAPAQGKWSGVTLRVGTWGGSWKDAVHKHVGQGLESQGLKIEYVVGNPAENLAKLVAARGRGAAPIDVMEIGPAERVAMLREGFLEDVPAAMVPNLGKVPAQAVEKQVVAYDIIQNGIVYRVDKFSQEGIPVPKTYGDLIHPKLQGRVAFPDITNTQHWTAVSALAVEGGGSAASPDAGFERVQRMKPLYFFSAASELANKFNLGDAVAAPWHAGWGVRLSRGGMNVGFVHPRVGDRTGAIEWNYIGIVKGARNLAAAAAYLNAFLDTEPQAAFARAVGVAPVNRDARAILARDTEVKRFMLLTDQELDGAYSVNWDRVDQAKWRAAWNRMLGK